MVPTRNPRLWSMVRNISGVRCTHLLSMINGHTTPIFVENSHEWSFSIKPKANIYRFLTKKRSPPKIQECVLWKGNICRARCTCLMSMINGHTTPNFVENSMNDHFQYYRRQTPTNFLPRNGLHWKSKIVIYGKETYVRWSVRASGRWSMATQPPFLTKITINDHFQ
jgi:hypothetical protein